MQQEAETVRLNPLRILKLTQSSWNYQMLNQLDNFYKNEIRETLKSSSTLKQFITIHEDKILDIITRKEDFHEYFKLIKQLIQEMLEQESLDQTQNQATNQIVKMYESCSFQEFLNLLMMISSKKTKLALNLKDIRCPIPILYELQGKYFYEPYALKDIFLNKESHLIICLRSENSYEKQKGMTIKKIFQLDQSYLQIEGKKEYLNVFVDANFKDEKISLADLRYDGSQDKEDKNRQRFVQYFEQILKLNSLIILLITEKDVENEYLTNNNIIKKACQDGYKLLILLIAQKQSKIGVKSKISKDLHQKIKNQIPEDISSNLFIQTIVKDKIKDEIYSKIENILKNANKKFTYLNFCEPTMKQEVIKYRNKAYEILKQLDQKQWTKKDVLSHLYLRQKIYENKKKLSDLHFNDEEKIKQINSIVENLEKQFKQKSLSKFIKQLLPYLRNQTFKAIFQNQLSQWRNCHLSQLLKQQQKLSSQRQRKINDTNANKQITERIDQILQRKNQFDITIENIVNELQFQSKKSNQKSQRTNFLHNYYLRALQNYNPLNIIDGSCLQFRNQHLQATLRQISQQCRLKKKEIYVVSVVGAQSSAKSTLLKYLFGTNFQVGAGRCTKGVYFGLCQIQNMVIVVIDTQGLLSPVARDQFFDKQIITFVLKYSNAIILNCKGQLSATLRDMLELCMYVIYLMNKSQKIIDDHPKRLIFVLRDQIKPSNSIQNEMLNAIKNNFSKLKDQYNLNYTDYFKIDNNDIISLPSAFNEDQRGSNYSISPNIMFGKYILFLRNIIINRLKEQKQYKKIDLEQVIKVGQNLWNIIQSCGKDLMYFKQLYLVKQRQQLQTIYYKVQNQKLDCFKNKFQSKIKQLTSLKSEQALKSIQSIRLNINQQLNLMKKQIKQSFKQQCRVNDQSELHSFNSKIQEFVEYLKYSKKKQLNERQMELKIDFQIQFFEDKIHKQILKIINSDSKQKIKEIKQLAQKSQEQINNHKTQMYKNIDNKEQYLKKQIDEILNQIYSIQQVKSQLKINSIQDCFDKVEKLQLQYLSEYQEIANYTLSNWKQIQLKIDEDMNRQESYLYLYPSQNVRDILYYFIRSFQNEIFMNKEAINLVYNIKEMVLKIYQKIKDFMQSFPQILATRLRIDTKEIIMNRSNIKMLLLGRIFTSTIKSCINQLKQIESIKAMNKKDRINQKWWLAEKMINAKKNLQIIQQTIVKEVQNYSIKFHTNNINLDINSRLDTLKANLEKFKQQGINNSINIQRNGKQKWKQCFKFICNKNKFLLQLLCKKKQVIDISFAHSRRNETQEEAERCLKDHIQKFKNQQTALRQLEEKFYMQIPKFEQTKIAIFQKITTIITNQKQQMLKQRILDRLDKNSQFNNERKIKEKIQQKISQELIGCNHQCPLCSAKCMKSFNHEGGHQVQRSGHLMMAFAGVMYKNKCPATTTCFTLSQIKKEFHSCNGTSRYQNKTQFIKAEHPKWLSHFNDKALYQTSRSQSNLQKIWANISDMLIKYKFNGMMVQNNIFANRKEDQLTEQDLDEKYKNYLGDETSLRDYL